MIMIYEKETIITSQDEETTPKDPAEGGEQETPAEAPAETPEAPAEEGAGTAPPTAPTTEETPGK